MSVVINLRKKWKIEEKLEKQKGTFWVEQVVKLG